MKMLRTLALMLACIGAGAAWGQTAVPSTPVTVYKSPTCGCCGKWVEHLGENGFEVETVDVNAMTSVKESLGVPQSMYSCHTAQVGGYVIEGHVPAADITRLLQQRPPIAGLAVPGMPIGSPGMEGPNPQAYDVIAFDAQGGANVFSRQRP